MKPLVTIAIPAYKAGRLRGSIASALRQTYGNTEVVIVNDQSPEDVDSVVRAFDDPRIRYFVNEGNVGKGDPSRNWNECLRRARGEWFCLLCDDDQYAPTFVETLLRLAEQHPECNVLRSRVRVVDGEGREVSLYPESPEWESLEDYMWDLYHSRRRQTISEFMVRTQTMREAGGYTPLPYAWGSDNLSIFRFARHGGIASTHECLTTFCDSGANISSDARDMDEKLVAFRQYIEQVRQIVEEMGFKRQNELLPVIDAYYHRACVAHMAEADHKALGNIVRNRRKLSVSSGDIARALLRRWRR